MQQAPMQEMLGVFSVFVRWVSGITDKGRGPFIRIRACIGNQWSTVHIPMEIAPDLKKGDFIVVEGNVTALQSKDNAEPYLFVTSVRQHFPAETVPGNGQLPERTSRRPAQAQGYAPPVDNGRNGPSNRGYQNNAQRGGGYRSNQKTRSGADNRPSESGAPREHRVDAGNYQRHDKSTSGGYQSNQRVEQRPPPKMPPSHEAHAAPQPQQTRRVRFASNRSRSGGL